MTRTSDELFKAFELATKENPLVLSDKETDIYGRALRAQNQANTVKGKLTTFNRDILFQEPVLSPVDGKRYGNRKEYDAHLRAHGCFEVGNEKMGGKHRETQGDFDCRKELTEVLKQRSR